MIDLHAAFSSQCRAARELLGWSQSQLSAASGVPLSSVRTYEKGETLVNVTAALRAAFEREGIRFIIETRQGESVVGVELVKT